MSIAKHEGFHMREYLANKGWDEPKSIQTLPQSKQWPFETKPFTPNGVEASQVKWETSTSPKIEGAYVYNDKPLATQVGGSHYKDLKIQPVEYNHANNIPYMEGNVIKYVTRWRAKGGIKDLEKARHYIDLLIELEQKQEGNK